MGKIVMTQQIRGTRDLVLTPLCGGCGLVMAETTGHLIISVQVSLTVASGRQAALTPVM